MLKQPKTYRIKAVAMAVAFACLPLTATAAGLGRISVNSALGQPLRAELEVTASSDELNSLTAKLASADAFRAAGIEYVPVLSSLRFAREIVERDGKRFIQISTDRPLNEPFVDMLVELSWASGRLVREFTFLLDPPRATMTAPAPIAAPEVKAQPVVPMAPAKPAIIAPARVAPPVATPQASRIGATEKSRLIKSGDTLRAIASETVPSGVSLDQMLVALFKSNAEAFDGNMNRMRAGKILSIPDAEAARSVAPAEARREVMAQTADFNDYRRQLAGAAAGRPAAEASDTRASSGRIAPKVATPTPPASSGKDKLEVSRTDASSKADATPQLQSRLAALEEDLVARDRALREANSRIAQLEKNLADLKQLAALKSEAGAAAQAKAEAAKPAAPVAPAPVAAPPAAAPTPPPPAPAAVEAAKPPAAQPAEPSKPAAAAPAPEPASVPAAAPAPAPAKKKVVPPPPPPPEPDFLEENGLLVFGGAGVLAVLLGYLGFSAYRKRKLAASAQAEPAISQEDLSRSSVFSETASAIVAEPEAPASEFSISEPSTESDSAAVDPIVEAETYLAFGRDSQAEEILLDALNADPTRLPVQLKLLDIYSARRSMMQFNTLAKELKAQTGGAGPDWERVLAMGAALDPDNPLYGGGEPIPVPAPEPNRFDMESTMVFNAPPPTDTPAAPEPASAATEDVAALDFDLDLGSAEPKSESAPGPGMEVAAAGPDTALDFDLGLDKAPEPAADAEVEAPADTANLLDIDFDLAPSTPAAAPEPAVAIDVGSDIPALDLDLGGDAVQATVAASPDAPAELAIDFSLDVESPASGAGAPLAVPPAPDLAADVIDFDFDLGEAAAPAEAAAAPATAEMPGLDLDLDLDLAAEAPATNAAPDVAAASDAGLPSLDLELTDTSPAVADTAVASVAPPVAEDAPGEDNPEAATKLELAAAYEEMGDRDGARELLEEVLNEGSATQRDAARERLDTLG